MSLAPTADRPFSWMAALLLPIAVMSIYAGSLAIPFDFEDDGLVIYHDAPKTDLSNRLQETWQRTLADLESRGPFRPVYWAYFDLQDYWFGADVYQWRIARLCLLGVTSFLMFRLCFELGLPALPSAAAVCVGLIAPMRSSVWYHFAFGEGIGVPMAVLALIAACRAARSRWWFLWDLVGIAALSVALLTKNVFVAVLPAQLLLRAWSDDLAILPCIRRNWFGLILLALPLALPVGHFLYFQQAVHGHSEYQVTAPGLEQFQRMARGVLLAGGADFLGAGFILAGLAMLFEPAARRGAFRSRRAIAAGALLLLTGIAVYMPVIGARNPAGRYTLPAALGMDLWIACIFAGVAAISRPLLRGLVAGALILGSTALLGHNVYQQVEFAGRTEALWQLTGWLKENAKPGSAVIIGEDAMTAGELSHLGGHLRGIGRGDLRLDYTAAIDKSIAEATTAAVAIVERADPNSTTRGLSEAGKTREPSARFDTLVGRWTWSPGGAAARKRQQGVVVRIVNTDREPSKPEKIGQSPSRGSSR